MKKSIANQERIIMNFIRYRSGRFEKITWFKNDQTGDKRSIVQQITPSPDIANQVINSNYQELFIPNV